MLNLCILVLSNTSIYLILTEIRAVLFFFRDELNVKIKLSFVAQLCILVSANLRIYLNMHFDAYQFSYLAKYAFWRMPI